MENFIDVPKYEGLYKINKQGDVYSFITNKILIHNKNTRGYHYVRLCKNKEQKNNLIHRLVAEAFILNQNSKEEVNHIDGDKNNNAMSNLEWCTSQENKSHAWSTGLCKSEMYKIPKKLTKSIVDDIRLMSAMKVRGNKIAEKYNVSPTMISYIINNKQWI